MGHAEAMAQTDSLYQKEQELQEVTVTSHSGTRRLLGAVNGVRIGQDELFRMACCNLGESFATNPSVDVQYNDAATGARQIKLLGLSGTYVQMLTETMPNFRGAAAPFALGYVPGVWMKAINVSKGAASVKNGYESITGQIDIDYLKPDDDQHTNINMYGDSQSRLEANFDTNLHLNDKLSTVLLGHYENRWGEHDGNGDGFQDMPKVRQLNFSNRWKYRGGAYMFHGGLSLLNEKRESGQVAHHGSSSPTANELYRIGIDTERYEGYMKHALMIDADHQTNIALMANMSLHKQDALYGLKTYDVNQLSLNAQLMYETNFSEQHALSAGLSLLHDNYKQHRGSNATLLDVFPVHEKETVPGAYAQYTLTLGTQLTAMAGIRLDHSSLWGTFVTPRFHVKYQPWDVLSLRISAGKGYRTVHALAENHNLLAAGRILSVQPLDQEEAWNYGVSAALNIPISEKTLKVNAEFYYTDFIHQAVIDFDSSPSSILITRLTGDSYSRIWQIDASFPVVEGLTLTAAYRRNDVKCTYGGKLMEKPLTNRYKALLTAGYKTPLELWQFDVTLQLNGGGRLYSVETPEFKAFPQLSAQATRKFRHIDIYVGGENLTGYKQKNPIIGAENPWSLRFDPTMVYAPVDGAMVYVGFRVKI